MTVEIARSANSTARGASQDVSSRTRRASALPTLRNSRTEYYSRTVMSSFLASRASSEEKSDSRSGRSVRSGRTKAPVLFPCLHAVPVSLALFFTSPWNGPAKLVLPRARALFLPLSRRAVESRRARPGHSRYAPRVPTYTRCKYTRECIICLYTRCPEICAQRRVAAIEWGKKFE